MAKDFRAEHGSSQGQNLVVTGLVVPSSLDSEARDGSHGQRATRPPRRAYAGQSILCLFGGEMQDRENFVLRASSLKMRNPNPETLNPQRFSIDFWSVSLPSIDLGPIPEVIGAC